MPRLTVYEGGQVPLAEPRMSVQASGQNPIAQGLAAVGEGLGNLAEGLQKHAFEQNQTAAKSADVAFTNSVNDLLYAGDNPYMAQEGENAVAGRESALAEAQKAYETASQGLSPDARKMFDSVAQPKLAALHGDINQYALKQGKVAQDTASVARQEQSATEYGRYVFSDPDRASTLLNTGEAELATRLARNGVPSDAITTARQQFRAKAFADAAEAQLNYDPRGVQAFLDKHAEDMDPNAVAAIHAKAKGETDRVEGYQAAQDAMQAAIQPRPATAGQPVSVSDIEGIVKGQWSNARITDRVRPRNAAYGVANSFHKTGEAIDFVPPPGVSLEQARDAMVAQLKAKGIKVREALAEHAGAPNSTGPHVHIAWDGHGGVPLQTNGLPDRQAFVSHVMAQAGEDPQRRMVFQQQAEAAWGDLSSNHAAREDAANDAVQPYLRDPKVTAVGQIPANVWNQLPETTKTTVFNHFQAQAKAQAEAASQQQQLDLAARYGVPLDPHSETTRKALDQRYVEMAKGWKPEEVPARTLDFVKTYRLVPNTATRLVEGGMRSADPKQRVYAAQLYGAITAVSPMSDSDFADHERSQARAFLDYTASGVTPERALALIDADAKMTPDQARAREQAFRDLTGGAHPKFDVARTIDQRLRSEAKSGLLSTQARWSFGPLSGTEGAAFAIPPTMLAEIKQNAMTFYKANGGNMSAAINAAYDTARNVWGPSLVTGQKAFVKNAPEVLYRHYGVVEKDAHWIMEEAQARASRATGHEVKGLTLQEIGGQRLANGGVAYWLMHDKDGVPQNVRDKTGQAVVFRPQWDGSAEHKREQRRLADKVREAKARRAAVQAADVEEIKHSLDLAGAF